MKKLKAFNMVELMIVGCLLLTTIILCLPIIFNNSKQAKVISGWKKMYGEMQSNFEVFNIGDKEKIDAICSSNIDNKELETFKIISPYLNVDLNKNTNNLKFYHYKFKNGSQISMQSNLYSKLFSYQENGNIVIYKWISCDCDEEKPCAVVLFDMNGNKKPNRIGLDIFGAYLFKNRIEAFGSDLSNLDLRKKCNGDYNGMVCSEYYLRGGRF